MENIEDLNEVVKLVAVKQDGYRDAIIPYCNFPKEDNKDQNVQGHFDLY